MLVVVVGVEVVVVVVVEVLVVVVGVSVGTVTRSDDVTPDVPHDDTTRAATTTAAMRRTTMRTLPSGPLRPVDSTLPRARSCGDPGPPGRENGRHSENPE